MTFAQAIQCEREHPVDAVCTIPGTVAQLVDAMLYNGRSPDDVLVELTKTALACERLAEYLKLVEQKQ